MVDPESGEPITDPAQSAHGLLLPMAGLQRRRPRVIPGMLGGVLNGALFGRDCIDFNAQPDAVTNTGQFVLALDVARFQPYEQFVAEVRSPRQRAARLQNLARAKREIAWGAACPSVARTGCATVSH